MSLPLLVLGAGGHAKVLIDALLANSEVIAGVIDLNPLLTGTSLLGVPVLGVDEVVDEYPRDEILLVNGIGSVDLPEKRKRVFERYKKMGYIFASVIHPSAVVAVDVELGEGVQILAGAVIQTGCHIGDNVIINTRASLDHDSCIGDHSHIAPGVTISGNVQVGKGVHLGTGSTVIQGISIGNDCLIAAGAVVIAKLATGSKARGVPAKEYT